MLPPPWAQDTDDIDFLLSMSMSEFGNCIMQLLATIIFIAVVQVGGGLSAVRPAQGSQSSEAAGSGARQGGPVECIPAWQPAP